MTGDREKCLAAGMRDHVAKPIEPKILFDTLVKWIPAVAKDPSFILAPKNSFDQAAAFPKHFNGIDIETGLRRTGGNRELYIDLLKHFVKDHGNDHQVILETLSRNDSKVAHRVAHTLKGVAGGIGALALYESAQKLETALKDGDDSHLPALMGILTRDLREVVEDLQRKILPQISIETDTSSMQVIDTEKMTFLFDSAQGLAEEMDPDVGKKAEKIHQLLHLHGGHLDELSTRLLEQAENFDFQEALTTLVELRAALKIVL